MTPSPFHGIFSALQQDNGLLSGEAVPEPVQPAEPSGLHAEQRQPVQKPLAQKQAQISVDVYEHDSYIIIRAPIAGVKLADLDIEVDGKAITIRGKRTQPDDVPSDQYYVQECYWGEFTRSVTLPGIIDPKKIRATFSKDSVLKIIIPKEEKVKIVRINEGG